MFAFKDECRLILVRLMNLVESPGLRWGDIYDTLDAAEDEEQLNCDALLHIWEEPSVTAYISSIYLDGERIVAHAHYDADSPDDLLTVRPNGCDLDGSFPTPLTWNDVRLVLEDTRGRARNFENLAQIGLPPDFDDQRFTGFVRYFYYRGGIFRMVLSAPLR